MTEKQKRKYSPRRKGFPKGELTQAEQDAGADALSSPLGRSLDQKMHIDAGSVPGTFVTAQKMARR